MCLGPSSSTGKLILDKVCSNCVSTAQTALMNSQEKPEEGIFRVRIACLDCNDAMILLSKLNDHHRTGHMFPRDEPVRGLSHET